MKRALLGLTLFVFWAASLPALAAKSYQVTGPVLEVTADKIVVEKGKEKWEISRDAATATQGELKVGSKVTIQYEMKAKSVEVKDAAKAKETPKK